MIGKSYLLNEMVLHDLAKSGLEPSWISALEPLKGRKFSNRKDFKQALAEQVNDPPSKTELKLIFRYSRRSPLGLEQLLPWRPLREWAEALIFALAVALIVRTFLFAPFKIPSGSMIPAIRIGDHIFASMFSYGLPIPFTDHKLFASPIQRGDIIIFPFPLDPSLDYIKRAIALEGETIAVRGTTVYIDGKALDEPYAYHDPIARAQFSDYRFGPVTVPPGKIFVMGDNRLNSADSREWRDAEGRPQPFVDVRKVKGKGQVVYWSHDPYAGLFGGYQPERIGTILR